MISRYTYKQLTWVNIESPTQEEILHISEEFFLPRLVADEMVNSTLRSKADLYENCIYVILHFPLIHKDTGKNFEQEIDFVIGKDFLITIHYEPIETLTNFAEMFEVSSFFEHDKNTTHGGFLFMQLMRELYKTSLRELDTVMQSVKKIEEYIFNKEERNMVRLLLGTSQKILDFKQAMRFHRDILRSYESASHRFFGDEYIYYASVITSEFNKVNSLLEGLSETFTELQNINNSLLSTRTNEIMKTLTIITFIMMPLTIITGIFCMNTGSDIVFIRDIKDFYFVLGSMFLTSLVMFIYFRYRKWL